MAVAAKPKTGKSKSRAQSQLSFSWADGTARLIRSGSWGPRVCTLSNGTLIAGYETPRGIYTAISENQGETWTSEAKASFHDGLSCANVNLFQMGRKLYLAYRATGKQANGFYSSLQVSISNDNGHSWKHHSTVAEYTEANGNFRGVWEPFLGLLGTKLAGFYANDSTSVTPQQNIEYKIWNGKDWTGRTVISDGVKHRSRDGMPVWTRLASGEYACVIESTHLSGEKYPFVVCILYSKDGKHWSEPVEIYRPTTLFSKAGAPGLIELPNGQLVVSFQTDEDASKKGDQTSVMKTILSDGTPVRELKRENFTRSDNVFGTPDGESSCWTGIFYDDGTLYAAAGTKQGSMMKTITFPDKDLKAARKNRKGSKASKSDKTERKTRKKTRS